MAQEEPTELDNLVGGGKKRRGCCSSHPIFCITTLVVVVVLCLAVAILGSVFNSRIDQAVQNAIAQVRSFYIRFHLAIILF